MADYTSLVAQVRSKYGTPLGNENAWKVCNEVALLLRQQTGDQNWGLHKKGGNNWNGYAVDIVAYQGGNMFDILGSSEDAGTPQWSDSGDATVDWAPPVPLDDSQAPASPGTPTPPPATVVCKFVPPVPAAVDFSEVLARIDASDARREVLAQQLLVFIDQRQLANLQAVTQAINAKTFKLRDLL